MIRKIHFIAGFLILCLLLSCSGEEAAGCGKIKDANFSTGPTYVSLYMEPGNGANSFKIEYGITGFIEGSGSIVTTSNTQIQIDNLLPSTTYDFYITGICAAGDQSAAYKLSSVTTSPSQCTGTASAEIYQYSQGEVQISFYYDMGPAEKFEVEYGLQGFTLGNGTKSFTSFYDTMKVITGLQDGTTYDFYFRPYCSGSDVGAYRKITFTTASSCPAPVNLHSYLISGSCNAGTATRGFTWSYPIGNAQSYTISVIQNINELPGGGNEFSTSNTSIALTNMFCIWKGFYVKANCGNGESSAWAGPFIF